jgi:hypothetical protein
LDDWDLQKFIQLATKSDDNENRDSWTSFTTAKSSPDLLPIVDETDENPPRDILKDDQLMDIGIAV